MGPISHHLIKLVVFIFNQRLCLMVWIDPYRFNTGLQPDQLSFVIESNTIGPPPAFIHPRFRSSNSMVVALFWGFPERSHPSGHIGKQIFQALFLHRICAWHGAATRCTPGRWLS